MKLNESQKLDELKSSIFLSLKTELTIIITGNYFGILKLKQV